MPNPLACKHPLQADHAQLYDILISELTDFAVFLTDPDGCILSWNPGVERVLGYCEADWLGQSAEIIFTSEDRAEGVPQLEIGRAAQGGQGADVRWHVRKDGRRIFVEGTMVALRDEAGQLLGFSKVMRDVTARKERELQLQDALAYAEGIVDTVRNPMLVLDEDLRIRSANRSFYRNFHLSKDETENQQLYKLGNGQWALPQLRTLLEELVPKQTTIEDFEIEQVFPDLGRKVMLFNARKLWREGNHTELTLLAIEDITERKEAERALRKGEERWRSLFERMAEGFFVGEIICDVAGKASDFRFLEVNAAFQRLTGIAEAAGKTVREVIPAVPDDLIQRYARVASTGTAESFEINVPALQNHWFEARARPAGPGRFAVLFLDVTERKQAEAQLLESERQQSSLVALGDQLRDLKDFSSLAFAAMKIAGTALGVARAGYGKVDQSQEFVTIARDWTNGRVPSLAGTYRFSDFGGDLGGRLQRGEVISISDVSTDPITAGESERWTALDIRAVINLPLVENERLVAVLFIQDSKPRAWTEIDLVFLRKVADRTWAAADRARALHELQESEEFTRSVLASSPDCLKVVDLDGRLLSLNKGGCRQMEIDDLAGLLQRPWVDLWGEMRATAAQALQTAKEGHTARFEGFCPTRKGNPKWWEVVVTPIHDAYGNPVRILSLSRDITERQRAEQERERLTRELKRSNEELSDFAHIVAHDLQAPLRGMVSFAQLLQRNAGQRLNSEDNQFLFQIAESALRMQELVQALLRFAQVGQGEIDGVSVDMEDILDSVLRSLQALIEEHGAHGHAGVTANRERRLCSAHPIASEHPGQRSQVRPVRPSTRHQDQGQGRANTLYFCNRG